MKKIVESAKHVSWSFSLYKYLSVAYVEKYWRRKTRVDITETNMKRNSLIKYTYRLFFIKFMSYRVKKYLPRWTYIFHVNQTTITLHRETSTRFDSKKKKKKKKEKIEKPKA